MNDTTGIWLLVCGLVCGGFVGLFVGRIASETSFKEAAEFGRQEVRKEMVDKGYGEYKLDPRTGKVKFELFDVKRGE